MASETDIANLALGRLRISKTIADLDEQSTPARNISRVFTQCRQECLRAFPWPCATRAQQLVEVANQTFPGWTYVYQYPSQCLMVRAVADEGGIRFVRQFSDANNFRDFNRVVKVQPWQIALKDDNASNVILSDVPDAWAFMTFDLDTIGVFPADLASVIAWRVAMEVGGALQADGEMIDRAEQRYAIWFANASAQSYNESKDDDPPDSPSVSCRG